MFYFIAAVYICARNSPAMKLHGHGMLICICHVFLADCEIVYAHERNNNNYL